MLELYNIGLLGNSNINIMTTKQYQTIKLITVVILAIVFSQLILVKNYLIPVALMIVSSLFLMFLRRKVKGVVADERDYSLGGKAALLAMQIYSWIAAISMFVLYGLRDLNPSYEPIAITLAFSTCILMLIYSAIFKYYENYSLTSKKTIYTIIVLIVFVVMAVFSLRVFSGEDNWICQNGVWIKHGNPSFPAPEVECK